MTDTDDDRWMADFEVHTKVWIERAGAVVISDFRAGLLEAVAEHGSVAAAAEAFGLPYRTAWKKLREMETAAGVTLIESTSGGPLWRADEALARGDTTDRGAPSDQRSNNQRRPRAFRCRAQVAA